MTRALPYLTDTIPGIGGAIRSQPEDFRVEERPLYFPCGDGEHLYLKVTKRGLSTPQLVSRLASTLGIKALRIGVAGLKDARAVTTQMVSVQGVTAEEITRLRTDERLLSIEVMGRHRNRLRTGHHAGNVFQIVIRGALPSASQSVPLVFAELSRRGVPNYFGPQRQGRSGANYEIGARLLFGGGQGRRLPRSKRLWYLHAYQSYLFNQILANRISQLDRVMVGDWAMKHANGACFLVENEEHEQARAEAFEISPTGILFGSRAPWATGVPGEIERASVIQSGADPTRLPGAAKACGFRGERRSLRVQLQDLHWTLEGDAVTIAFRLAPGAYATSVLRELMKSAPKQLD
jgi:tRNA pseudouridine13 synthase